MPSTQLADLQKTIDETVKMLSVWQGRKRLSQAERSKIARIIADFQQFDFVDEVSTVRPNVNNDRSHSKIKRKKAGRSRRTNGVLKAVSKVIETLIKIIMPA